MFVLPAPGCPLDVVPFDGGPDTGAGPCAALLGEAAPGVGVDVLGALLDSALPDGVWLGADVPT
ncbi:hypothetical protein GCM10022267_79300 [Lentzea roselyniae]|uniref:Uncharacterized protein n=1 Tax=Lentzea roselyniae TaxID=531940 RepID=A0ABP7C5K4_9PSEU